MATTTAKHAHRAAAHPHKTVPAHVVFPPDVIAAAQATQKTYGVPASVTLAQWALESGYGQHMPKNSNNPFGIKAGKGQSSVQATTREEDKKGASSHLKQPFRKFSSINEAFEEHGRLLTTNPADSSAQSVIKDPDKFADALTGTYATDHTYGQKLKNSMKSHNLYQYDKVAPAVPAATPVAPAVAVPPTP